MVGDFTIGVYDEVARLADQINEFSRLDGRDLLPQMRDQVTDEGRISVYCRAV